MNSYRFLEGAWAHYQGEQTLHFERGDSCDIFSVTHNIPLSGEVINESVLICVSRKIEKGETFNFAGRGKFPKDHLRIVDENNIVLWNQNFTRLIPADFSFE